MAMAKARKPGGRAILEHTLCHIPGIGPKTERNLWAQGLTSWTKVLARDALPMSAQRAALLRQQLAESQAHLAYGNARHFHERLRGNEHWRMFADFQHSVAYLDIETTGLGGPGDYITTIALYDGESVSTYVHGDNLNDFRDDLRRYKLLVTYNGKSFDLPFIRTYLGIPVDHAHIDLRFILASLGYRGGLKGCEKQFGLDREELDGVDGFFAVLLWWDYQRHGNDKALQTLLAYNVLDVLNLETLMVRAYNLKLASTPFAETRRLPEPQPAENPLVADMGTVERLKVVNGLCRE